jgi:hypothetical protein
MIGLTEHENNCSGLETCHAMGNSPVSGLLPFAELPLSSANAFLFP